MKKSHIIILVLSVFACVAFFAIDAHSVLAETSQDGSGFTALAPITNLTDSRSTSVVNSDSLAKFLNNLYKYLVGLAAILAVIEIIYSGILIAVNRDSVSTIIDRKGRIAQAILGLVLVLSPVLVFSIINPSILNLSLNLPEINTRTTGDITGPGASLPPAPATGCTLIHIGDYLESALCASRDAALAYDCQNTTGLTLQAPPPCKKVDAGSGDCLDTPTVYCAGKTTQLTYYEYYGVRPSYALAPPSIVIPSDRDAENSFKSGCAGDGGTFSSTPTAVVRIITLGGNVAPSLGASCSGYQGITYDTNKYGGVICFSQNLSCNPPQ